MNDKLAKCIKNNNDLYQAIFESDHIKFHIKDDIAYTEKQIPPLYSNLVTRSKGWAPDDIFSNIDRHYEDENWSEWSIKDSFSVLDLAVYDFQKLFDAQWIYLQTTDFKPLERDDDLRYENIKTEKELSDWRIAWDSDVVLGEKIFKTKLLNNPNIDFIAGYEKARLISGCLVNKTDDLLGISNFFAPRQSISDWSNIVTFILKTIGNKDIVGYERESSVGALKILGFESLGSLTVWIKRRVKGGNRRRTLPGNQS
jgi:hypothetical protein